MLEMLETNKKSIMKMKSIAVQIGIIKTKQDINCKIVQNLPLIIATQLD